MLHAYAAECRAAGHRPNTIRLRLSYLSRVPNLCSATRGDLVDFLAAGDSWKPETLKAVRSALRSFYGWMVAAGHRLDNPAVTLRAVRIPATMPHPCPDDVFELALVVATDRDQMMLALGAWAGLRRAEIAGLGWTDIADGIIRVVGKGGRVRQIPISPRLGDVLTQELVRRRLGRCGTGWVGADPDSPWLFPARTGGGPMPPDSVGVILTRCLGGGWTGHSLRHRFATRAYGERRDLFTVQQLLGHAKPETTARYAAPPADSAAAAVAAAAA